MLTNYFFFHFQATKRPGVDWTVELMILPLFSHAIQLIIPIFIFFDVQFRCPQRMVLSLFDRLNEYVFRGEHCRLKRNLLEGLRIVKERRKLSEKNKRFSQIKSKKVWILFRNHDGKKVPIIKYEKNNNKKPDQSTIHDPWETFPVTVQQIHNDILKNIPLLILLWNSLRIKTESIASSIIIVPKHNKIIWKTYERQKKKTTTQN